MLLFLFSNSIRVMNECFGKKFIHNGRLDSCEHFENSMVYEGESVYEVIRMIRGIPVFFDDHYERLETSAKLRKKNVLADRLSLRKDIISLAKSDKKKEANIKIVFNYRPDDENYMVYFIESFYPSEEQYRNGVKGILFNAERKDPASKVIYHKLRSSISHRLMHENGYEALLVNEQGYITEGSRTNIFFLKDNTLTTAPDEMVLGGITRKHLLEICREQDIKVIFRCVEAERISEYDAVFMTGTSPMVLPFRIIGNTEFSVKITLIDKLRNLYIKKVEESLSSFRSE